MISAPTPDPSASFQPAAIDWSMDALGEGVEEGYLDVPIDYAHPDDGMLRLYSPDISPTIPAVWVRCSSTRAVPASAGVTSPTPISSSTGVLDAFDIIGFDPRGTGLSEPAIDCVDDYDHFYAGTDITPDDDAERQQIVDLAEEFADACVANNADIIQFVGTNNAARDIDSIRRALGEDRSASSA